MTTLDQAIAQMRANGMPDFPPGHPRVGIGRITRYGPKKAAWYRLEALRTDGNREVIVGAYGYWGKLDTQHIEVDWKGISAEERAAMEKRAREAERIELAKREERAGRAANRAIDQWRGALTLEQLRAWLVEHGYPERTPSEYLKRKGVSPEGCRFLTDGTIYVPMLHYDATDGAKLAGLQKIASDGSKRFNKGMAKEGAACRLGEPPADGDVILITEGYATALTLREATLRTLPIFIAFDAGNLRAVAERLRARYPLSPFIFCADDDWKTKRYDGTPWNPGLEYAQVAARAVGYAWVVRPLFLEASREEKWTDFNDLHAAQGIDAVRGQLNLADIMSGSPAIMAPGQKLELTQEDREIAESIAAIRKWREDPVAAGGAGGDGEPPGGSGTPSAPGGESRDSGRSRRWYDDLQKTKDGAVKCTISNAVMYLTHHQLWQGVLAYDTFSETVVKVKPPPYQDSVVGEWSELDDHRLLLWFSGRIGEPGTEALQKAIQLAAHKNEFNPLRDRLDGLKHDGKARLKTWLFDYLGVSTKELQEQLAQLHRAAQKDLEAIKSVEAEITRLTRYVELVGMKWMIAAVARVFEPGCRVDHMLILEGEQGAQKSTTIEILGGKWYTDARLNFDDKDSLLIIQGRWIIEMAELEGMNKIEASATKKFLTQHIDLFRPPYGRKLVSYPRRCIFTGTVNLDAYLKDDSGNRRFWPVRVGAIHADALRADVDQLWAEAVAFYKAGMPWWVLPEERDLFVEQQEQRFAVDAWEDLVLDYLDGRGSESQGQLNRVTVSGVMEKALKLDKARWDRQAQLRVVGVLRRHGWQRKRETARDSTGTRPWYYLRPEIRDTTADRKDDRDDSESNGYHAAF